MQWTMVQAEITYLPKTFSETSFSGMVQEGIIINWESDSTSKRPADNSVVIEDLIVLGRMLTTQRDILHNISPLPNST